MYSEGEVDNARKRKDNWWNKIFEKFQVYEICRIDTRVILSKRRENSSTEKRGKISLLKYR